MRAIMRGHLRRLAGPMLLALGLLALAVAAVFVAAGRPGLVLAEVRSLPPVPHSFEGRENCLLCHGPAGSQAMPANHAARPEPTCRSCHKAAGDQSPPAPSATSPTPPFAAEPIAPAGAAQSAGVTSISASDAACASCHRAVLVVTLSSRETLTATVDVAELSESVHGRKLTCVACHADKSAGYPHPALTAADRRSYAVAAAAQCVGCHKGVSQSFDESVHGEALSAGNVRAASCTDCHGAHNVTTAARLERKPQTCASCHGVVTDTYRESVHGQLLAAGRADAASCLACHSGNRSGHTLVAVNDPEGPTSEKIVPETCGTCHKQALKSYNSTFHGRAMRLGVAHKAPNCVDCHGAYGVQRVHAAEEPLGETHFATVCAKCHPGADDSFAGGWMGHEEPSPDWFPVVFFTERFLFFLTTTVVAFGILHVELDLLRWLVDRRKHGGRKEDK